MVSSEILLLRVRRMSLTVQDHEKLLFDLFSHKTYSFTITWLTCFYNLGFFFSKIMFSYVQVCSYTERIFYPSFTISTRHFLHVAHVVTNGSHLHNFILLNLASKREGGGGLFNRQLAL